MEIIDLYCQQQIIPVIAEIHKQQFRKYLSDDREALLRSRISSGHVPKTFVAMMEDSPAGFVCLIQNNFPERPELSPWLASLCVLEQYRRKGIGRALVERCINQVTVAGCNRLYLFTSSAVAYYEKLGWKRFDEVEMSGSFRQIMCRDIPKVSALSY